MSTLTVVIPTHNRPVLLHDAIESIMQQTRPADEIIIVDDGSEQSVSESKLRARYSNSIRVLRNEEAHGLAWARNQGAEQSRCDLVAHLDDDDRYAPETLQEAVELLEEDAEREVVFLGAKGFGKAGEHFDRALGKGVSGILRNTTNRTLAPGIVQFGSDIMCGFFRSVPSTFQHVVTTKQAWDRISGLRRKAYMLQKGVDSEADAKSRITGPLRDSEWALYAAALCDNAVLLNRPRYLARCDGQGYSSISANREKHLLQQLGIKEVLYAAALVIPELSGWKEEIGENLGEQYFECSYYYFHNNNRRLSWRYVGSAMRQQPRFKYAKFAVRTLFPAYKP